MACGKHLYGDQRIGHGVGHDRVAQQPPALLCIRVQNASRETADPLLVDGGERH